MRGVLTRRDRNGKDGEMREETDILIAVIIIRIGTATAAASALLKVAENLL
jgi:hypothetical protein